MQLIVHRGTHEIGGSCIEVSEGTTRIILDAGLPLVIDPAAAHRELNVPGLFDVGTRPVDALFLSHAHADHSGLIPISRDDVPVWMSEGTSKMILAGSLFAKQPSIPRKRVKLFKPLEPVTIGSLTVTAYPVDHSVYDAMAFVVEGGGKRLLYTGDLRSHGRKRGMGAQLLRAAKQAPIDALVIEGTRLGARSTEPNLSERDLEKQILADLRKAPGLALAMYSPLNLDRFVTFYKAALRSGRTFVIDPYQAFALHLINRKTLPQPSAKGHLRVLVPPRYPRSAAGRRLGHTNWAQSLGDGNITRQEILSEPGKYLLLYRISMQPWLIGAKPLQQTTYFFSYWPGYLEQPEMKQHMELLNEAGCSVLRRHASGHAHLEDLKSFPKLVPSKRLIPVHGFRPDLWMNFEPHVTLAEDGQPLFL